MAGMARKVGEQQRFEIRLFLQRTRERGGEIVDHDVEMPQGPVTTVVPAIAQRHPSNRRAAVRQRSRAAGT